AAAVSHLPQILAVALVEAAAGADSRFPGMLDLAAGGFRDTTRIASSDPLMWRDILLENGPAVLEMSAAFREGLGRLEEAIGRRDAGQIEVCLRRAKEIRDAWLRSRWENEKAGR
ncbi:MAG: prephenate dehydrogenase/arogenate dehydrogenase family protein, partial [Actinobacteria bacterium]|nr:prephenate dehydrogenase/arogenate dehydrogenase family protein [Actinomycetota bacterium]